MQPTHAGIALLGLALLSGSVGPPATAKPPTETGVYSESTRVTLRSVRLRIERVRGGAPFDCSTLGLDDLQVSLRGDRLPRQLLVDLERRQVRTLHALLIDTSASMVGKLGAVRDAARNYVEHLRPGLDRALVATFDENTLLLQGATDDQEALSEAIGRVRMGHATSLHDGLYHIIETLNAHSERPVVVLLTDGVDTASLYERDDVNALAEVRPDLTVFPVGYALPDIHAGRAGMSSAKRFLQNLAHRTGGEFFDVPTASGLNRAYRRVQTMLASEATLTLTDPDPEASTGRVKVRSKLPECKVTVFREEPQALPTRTDQAAAIQEGASGRRSLPPSHPLRVRYGLPGSMEVPAGCEAREAMELPDAACFVEVLPDRLSGCALDVAMDVGMLYSTLTVSRWEVNDWIELRIRPFEIAVPKLAGLPGDPVDVLDALAIHAVATAGTETGGDHRQQPADRHARPFTDFPALVNGRTYLDTRTALASGMFQYPEYADWARTRLAREAERRRDELSETFRRIAPGLSQVELNSVVEASAAGRRIRRLEDVASAEHVRRYLGAWLGDVSAHDLFARWEVLHANRLLVDGEAPEPFLEAWAAVRRVFFVPSYARVLTLLHPIHDPAQDRIGFWRVVLPRVSWLLPRVQNTARHPEFGELPLDLVPDRPLGFQALSSLQSRHPETASQLREAGYRVASVSYELVGKPWKRDPPRAFREARVVVDLESAGRTGVLQLTADMEVDPGTGRASIHRCDWRGEFAEQLPSCEFTPPDVD